MCAVKAVESWAVGMSSEGWRKCRLGEPHGKGGGAGLLSLTHQRAVCQETRFYR